MSKRDCPRCESPMVERRYDGAAIQSCPGCHGLEVGLRDLRRVAERLARDLVGKIDLEVPGSEGLGDPSGGLACACGKEMDNFAYLGLPDVRLDRCEWCERVWLDAEELELVARTCARSEGRIRVLYEDARKGRQTYVDNPEEVMRGARRRVDQQSVWELIEPLFEL